MEISQQIVSFRLFDLRRFKSVCSPKIFIQNVPWVLEAKECVKTSQHTLRIHLKCEKEDSNTDWSYVASAKIALLPLDDRVKAVKCYIKPNVYHNKTSIGVGNFIDWDQFYWQNKFVKNENDKINLKVEIEMMTIPDSNQSALILKNSCNICNEHCCAKIELTIEKVDNLVAVELPLSEILKLPVILTVYKHNGYLDVKTNIYAGSSWHKLMLTKVISNIKESKSVEQVQFWHTKKLISWDELLNPDNGFVNKRSAVIEISFVSLYDCQQPRNIIYAMTSAESIPHFRIEVPSISALTVIHSPELMVDGIPWDVTFFKKSMNEHSSIAIILNCHKLDKSSKWSCTASSTIKLLPFSGNEEAIGCHIKSKIVNNNSRFLEGDLSIGWDKLFVHENEINFDISIEVTNQSGRFVKTVRLEIAIRANDEKCKISTIISGPETLENGVNTNESAVEIDDLFKIGSHNLIDC